MAGQSDKQLDKMTEEMAEEMGQLYGEVGDDIRNVLLAYLAARLTLKKRNEALSKIEVILADADIKTNEILDRIIPKSFDYGFESANVVLPAKLKKIPMTPALKEQIVLMVEDAKIDFGSGLAGARKAAGSALSQTMKEQLANAVAAGTAKGKSIPKITKSVLKILGNEGFTTFVRRNGSGMNLKAYSEMLTRTHVIKSANEATVQRGRQLDINILEMSTHSNVKDQPCLDVQGKLFDLNGKEHPKPPDMPIHPNCRHKLLLRPDLS
jgi:hypothetical protein